MDWLFYVVWFLGVALAAGGTLFGAGVAGMIYAEEPVDKPAARLWLAVWWASATALLVLGELSPGVSR